jgi:pimeloyl-ACP methyl ester carboxylesterase
MPSVKLSSCVVQYTEAGYGVPLILLHANPGSSEDFAAIMPVLAQRYRVIAIDWPGYGVSALEDNPATLTVPFFYAVLREFLVALRLPPAIFIGNSMGGNIAARLAILEPARVKSLVLVSPGGFTPHNFVTRLFCKLQGSRFSLFPMRFARWYLRARTPTTQAMLYRAGAIHSTVACIALNRAMWRYFAQPEYDLRSAVLKVTAPTLLVFGRYDPAVAASVDGKQARKSMPTAIFCALPCGHAAFAEVPTTFLSIVEPFLNRIEN